MEPRQSSTTHLADLSLTETAAGLRARDFSAVELLETFLTRIEQRNGGSASFDGAPDRINAWARLYPDRARAQAEQADQRLHREGDQAPLVCGIPFGVKDLYSIDGLPVTASSQVLEHHLAQETAPVVKHLENAGMVVLGHTHTHEFAAGGSTDQVGNPWDLSRSAGGSSGGSGAALAAGMAPVTLGTDTAGSVRIPASLCGVSAIKPSFNRVPTRGIIPLSPTLDHAGPMARSLADCALVLNEMTRTTPTVLPWMGWDHTPLNLTVTPDLSARPLAGQRIAVTGRNMSDRVSAEMVEGFERARAACEALGAEIVEIPAPINLNNADYDTVLIAEARAYHAQFIDSEHLYRGSTRDFLAFGSPAIPTTDYLAAQQRRMEVTAQWAHWFRQHCIDAVLEPTQAVTSPTRGHGYDPDQQVGGEDPMTLFTALWNFTGFPVVTLPTHVDSNSGLPVSVSLIGGPGQDHRPVSIGINLQHHELPPLGDAPGALQRGTP